MSYMDKDVLIPNTPPSKSKSFPKISRQAMTMMCLILGYDHDRTVDKVVLGFVSSIFPTSESPLTKFHYVQFLVDIIPYHLMQFHANIYFRNQPYLVYMILCFQASHFQNIQLKIEDELGNPW